MEDVSLGVAIVGFILVLLKFLGPVVRLIGSAMMVVGIGLHYGDWYLGFIMAGLGTAAGSYVTNKITDEEMLEDPLGLIAGVIEVIIGVIILACSN